MSALNHEESTNTAKFGRRHNFPIVATFIVGLLIPIQIHVGDFRLSFYRIILILILMPSLLTFIRSQDSRFRSIDFFVMALSIVGGSALIVTGSGIESFGIYVIETMGPFFLARAYIRTTDAFISAMRVLFICIIVTIPFAIYENFTRDPIILSILASIVPTLPNVSHEIRFGLDRAQVVLDHPILYGVFSSFAFASAIYVVSLNKTIKLNWWGGVLVSFAVFASLSSGAFVAVGIQAMLILWDRLTILIKRRWHLLVWSLVIVAAVIEIASSRTLAQISISFLALNPGTAWTRLAVNEYAIAETYRHPWFGIGLYGTFQRPSWLTGSVDNFWIGTALRYGIPTFILHLATTLLAILAVAFAANDDPRVEACRKAVLISVVAASVAAITVYLWDATYCVFFFMLGSGLWIADKASEIASDRIAKKAKRTGGSQRPFGHRDRSEQKGQTRRHS